MSSESPNGAFEDVPTYPAECPLIGVDRKWLADRQNETRTRAWSWGISALGRAP